MNFDLALLPKKYNSRIEVEWLSVAVCLFEHFMAVCPTYSWRKTEKNYTHEVQKYWYQINKIRTATIQRKKQSFHPRIINNTNIT
jgi:hypothetical protein